MRKRIAAAATAAGVLATSFAIGGFAYGAVTDNMYPTANTLWDCQDGSMGDGFCRTDNSYLTVFAESSISSAGRTNIVNTLPRFDQTDMDVAWAATASYSGDSETDVIYQRVPVDGLAGDAIGIAWCDDESSEDKCDQHYVVFEDKYTVPNTICHETGHAVGLTHGHEASPRLNQLDSRLHCMQAVAGYNEILGNDINVPNINSSY